MIKDIVKKYFNFISNEKRVCDEKRRIFQSSCGAEEALLMGVALQEGDTSM